MKGTIKTNREFVYAYKKGKKVVSDCIVFHYYKNRIGKNSLGITVTKTIGKAHVRNRAKRLIRSAYREVAPDLKQGYNIVIAARTKLAYASYDKVIAAMKYCVEKSELK